ncbi:aminoacyl-tRNA hydrolase [Candidatus Kaiserbacteria bacterium]|nr:aminoacyl-tRNA hydrolase [Candidatus Kaiserbacteria bacterium]
MRFSEFVIYSFSFIVYSMSWVIVGLGNPGEEYRTTRHNAGRMALEAAAKKFAEGEWKEDKKANATVIKGEIGTQKAVFVAPDTFMNKSGSAVIKYVKSVKAASQMIVVYDDLDLPLGSFKLSYDRGSGGHKGLESIMRAVKTKKFTRIRIGVSRASASGKVKKVSGEGEVIDFILARFKPAEIDQLKGVFKQTSNAIERVVADGPQIAMNAFN